MEKLHFSPWDYGDHLQAVAFSHLLHRLPASSLSGLAVRCHKAMIRPQASESRKITGTIKLALQVLTDYLES